MLSGTEMYNNVKELLRGANIPEAEAKARVLVAHVLKTKLWDIFLSKKIDGPTARKIECLANACACGVPVEYVTGIAYFRRCELEVCPAVLIPRSETELVAEAAITLINRKGYKTALDACTGSGCIAVSMAMETAAAVSACDISEDALKIAHSNAKKNNVKIEFFKSDMFSNVAQTYDIIVCNPPYISQKEYAGLEQSIRLYEPRLALLAHDGLKFYRIIAKNAAKCLNPSGALVLEIGANQAENVRRLLAQGGFCGIEINNDYSGRNRIVTAHIAKEE